MSKLLEFWGCLSSAQRVFVGGMCAVGLGVGLFAPPLGVVLFLAGCFIAYLRL